MLKQILVYLVCACAWLQGPAQPKTPAQLYPGLFNAVQMARIFPDGKTFPDCIPKRSATAIMASYNRQHTNANFDLKAFVKDNFTEPAAAGSSYHSNVKKGVQYHIEELWSILQRHADTVTNTSLIPLPYSYVVPGGRFREVYYWDSYFTMLGLEESKRYDVISNMVKNFAYLIDTYGHIPNGNRTYYLSRSQPPFFVLMVELLARHANRSVLITYRPQLIAEYNYWMKADHQLKPGQVSNNVVCMPDGSLLNRYWDYSASPRDESYREDVLGAHGSKQAPAAYYRHIRAAAESGWDFSSRWLADGKTLGTIQTTDLVAIDLNCILYRLEQTIASSCWLSGQINSAQFYQAKARQRRKAILKYCWNASVGDFQDYNIKTRKLSPQVTIATAYPLFFNLATTAQAKQIAKLIGAKFVRPGGVATTLVNTGQQWDSPNGWAPLQYITIAGLRNYGQDSLAQVISKRWISTNTRVFMQTGKLQEKYDVEATGNQAGGGEYPLQDGFGWTNGVLEKLMGEEK